MVVFDDVVDCLQWFEEGVLFGFDQLYRVFLLSNGLQCSSYVVFCWLGFWFVIIGVVKLVLCFKIELFFLNWGGG